MHEHQKKPNVKRNSPIHCEAHNEHLSIAEKIIKRALKNLYCTLLFYAQ